MPNLDIIYDVTIAVTWDEINIYKWIIYQPTCLSSFVTFDGFCFSLRPRTLSFGGNGRKSPSNGPPCLGAQKSQNLHKVLYSQTFSPCVINLSRNKNISCGLKKVVARSRARVYFEQQILVLLLVFHQTHNLSGNKLANQQISAPHFFNPQQMFLLRVKLIAPGGKRETSTKTCNETMLRDKLRVFVSRISPP